MPSKHSLTTVVPVDNTRVVIGPSRSPATQADSKKLNDANNRAIAANAEALYSVLRFTPYVKYITDVGDVLGVNPAAYGKSGEYDPTDLMGVGGQGLESAFNSLADKEAKGGSYRTTIGRGKNKHKVTLQRGGPDGWSTKFYKYAAKYNPLKITGIIGDVVQGVNAAKELYKANKNLQEVESSINWKQQPFRIDTSISREDNERFNSQFIRPRRSLGGNY